MPAPSFRRVLRLFTRRFNRQGRSFRQQRLSDAAQLRVDARVDLAGTSLDHASAAREVGIVEYRDMLASCQRGLELRGNLINQRPIVWIDRDGQIGGLAEQLDRVND